MTKQSNNLIKLLVISVLIALSVIAIPYIKTFLKGVGSETKRAVEAPQLLKERQAQQQADTIKDKIKKELETPKTPDK